jgi:ABC-2 type transport system ATP-binding protein
MSANPVHHPTAAVEVRHLTKHFNGVAAVDDISFEVARGEFFGFLGPNGAGKTTTVRVLTGVLRADGGTAVVMGFPAGSLRAKQMAGVVPEMANAYTDLSAWDNLMLMADLYGVPASTAKERARGLLQDLGLLERKDSLVRAYSRGMRQRLILAMALISDPEVLFLDEPTSGLDVQSSRLIKELLRKLNRAGKTIFLTTHDMDEANQLCQRVAIINKGKIVAIDSPERLRLATGRRHSVEVSFETSISAQVLASLPGVSEVQKLGDKYRLFTPSPGAVAMAVVEMARTMGLNIVSLNTLAPSLEDAFVALTEMESRHA